ncbi:cysteine-rich repeat secretory protein 55-like [Phalaenopsis equestris]|uniref:cysteine-rich repeat secretory protein 55-like n=1 Tax=Phalaenopsis equestris TaxID=78828 RepID=UPI0009E617EF|nr:cysteine-rich repeat secretory protein 55-like [Phalaenopsis equestris]
MEFSCKLFILVLLLPIIGRCSADFSHLECNKNFTIFSNNNQKQNIGLVISDLSAKPEEGFAASFRTLNSETIYGLTQCRGDINLETCLACILKATQTIQTACPYSAEAQIWLDQCTLRYGSDNFVGQADTSYARFWTSIKPAMNSIAFENSVDIALGVAKVYAMTTGSKFGAMASKVVNSDLVVYGMAQCTRDLPEFACGQCLDSLLAVRSTGCKGRVGCRVVGRSCTVRIENFNFLSTIF